MSVYVTYLTNNTLIIENNYEQKIRIYFRNERKELFSLLCYKNSKREFQCEHKKIIFNEKQLEINEKHKLIIADYKIYNNYSKK